MEFTVPSVTDMDSEISLISGGNFENLSFPLSEWQRSQLENVTATGIQCLIYMWLNIQPQFDPGTYCNATWDNFYCWPPTPTGKTVTRSCSQILEATYQKSVAQNIKGQAIRVCLQNATWLWDRWTNYTECADSIDEFEKRSIFVELFTQDVKIPSFISLINIAAAEDEEEIDLVVQVRYILFVGSILSFVCLVISLFIFCYFKCLRCDRVTVHVHLMIALTLRCILLVVITEPFIFNRTSHYRNVDFVCKTVLSINLYATVTSIHWMFLQGVYLHGKLTTNVFDKGTPFKIYYAVGWGLPLVLICAWAGSMEMYHPVECWKDYSDQPYIWILLGPMIFALVANLVFLINIMRILLTKIQRANTSTDAAQFRYRRAVKATAVLFPLLGINNLLFLYNPGGQYKSTFVILNTVCQSTQGIFVSILYCFLSSDVRDAIRRQYRRFAARRSANSVRRHARSKRGSKYNSNGGNYSITPGEQRALFITPTHFRSKFKTRNCSRSQNSKSPSPETINNILPSETPSSPSPSGFHTPREDQQLSPLSQPLPSCPCPLIGSKSHVDNRYEVSIPMRDFSLIKN